jgi:hypothetical protein
VQNYRLFAGLAMLIPLALSMRTFAIPLPVPRGTFPTAINARSEIAGHCVDSIAVAHGFVRDARGRITVFDAPGAGSQQRQGTFVNDINNVGMIVGYFIDSNRVHHGFVRDPNGAFTRLDAPGAGRGLQPPVMAHPELLSGQGTLATSLNDGGTITGYFIDAKNARHGFLRDKFGAFRTFDVTGSGGTFPESINNLGEIAGTYEDPPEVFNNERMHSYKSGAVHGFVRDAHGKITRLDMPGAAHGPGEGTYPQSVDDSGVIAGSYNRTNGGFIRDAHGDYTTFSAPDSSIRPAGFKGDEEITACHLGTKSALQGLGRSENGVISASGAAELGPGRYRGTVCASVIDGGALVGYYQDKYRANHGFIRGTHGALSTFDAPCEGSAVVITSVSPLVAGATELITIKGRRFGDYRSSKDSNEGRIAFQDDALGRGCGEDVMDDASEGGPLRVARWTDSEIVVTGFSWPAKGICPFHAGDQVSIGVWNAQTGAGPAHFELTVGNTSKDLTLPRIASVTPVYPGADQSFVIKGEGFGTQPLDYDSDYLTVWDETATWLGRRGNPNPDPVPHPTGFEPVTVKVGRWTPNEIEVIGFGGGYGENQWTVNGGDQITLSLWNPQTGAGPATFEVTVVSEGQNVVAPRIMSISAVTTRANQTIIIKGQGFGTHPPSARETTQFLLISDETAEWVAGRVGQNAYSVWLNVSRWTDTEIEVTGFAGAYGSDNRKLNAGDQINVRVWNAQTGAGPAVMSGEVAHETNADRPASNPGPTRSGSIAATMSVPAGQPWTPTGINLRSGDALTIAAEGIIVTNLAGAIASPGGTPPDCRVAGTVQIPFVAPELPCWSLIGRIGPQGHIFEIGSRSDLVASISGQLFLGVNDNFFGDNSGSWTAHVTANSSPKVAPPTECIVAGNTHGLIQIVSGTEAFAGVGDGNKALGVAPGSLLQGSVTLRVINGGPGFALAPLIQTPSWGNHETSWSFIGNVPPGESQFIAQVQVHAPLQPGTFHILFAFQLETNGGSVASATNWARRNNIWNDGNDIADFKPAQIQQAQQFGCAINPWLTETGIQPASVPADAITVDVVAR